MANFHYQCISDSGERQSGIITADSADAARLELSRQNLFVLKLKEESASLGQFKISLGERHIQLKHIILFNKQFRTLVNAGVPLVQILGILQEQTEHKGLKKALGDITQRISEGESLHSAFERHPSYFSSLYCSMLEAGERSGSLAEVLESLSLLLSHEDKIKKQISGALRYPKFVLAFMFGAFLILVNFVIPKFAAIFASAKLTLPLPTRVAMGLSENMAQFWWVYIVFLVATIWGTRTFFKTPKGAYVKDYIPLHLPVMAPLLKKSIIARFAATFSILQRSGISVLDSIDILTNTFNNAVVAQDFLPVKEQLSAGRGLSEPLRELKYFSTLAINMIYVGENSGNLEQMLNELAKHYDEELELAVENLSSALAPILLLLLGILVLFFALAVFLPMWDMMQIAQQ